MISEYLEEALKRASYEMIDDEEPFYGEVTELQGVWASGKTLEECRQNLLDVVEGWVLFRLTRGKNIPALGRVQIEF
ncbi:MAG: type II toxin-antitoxin system HicB family antitoxin [Okeania sp. SIO2H7]|nr:type II toxin-antitoxin system HicB family antitoxin [Okeania sp. SIO2H7]